MQRKQKSLCYIKYVGLGRVVAILSVRVRTPNREEEIGKRYKRVLFVEK